MNLSFDPNKTLLDITNSNYLNATSTTTTRINNYDYINGLTFKIDALSSTVVRFYKKDVTKNYTYPFETTNPIITINYE